MPSHDSNSSDNFKHRLSFPVTILVNMLVYWGKDKSYERDGLEAGVRGGKDCLRYDNNNPEHPKLSCDDPDECAGDNGGKDRNKTAKQIQHLLACLAGTDLLVGAVSSQDERFISD